MGRENGGQCPPIRLWHYIGRFRRFEARNCRIPAAITKNHPKFTARGPKPVKLGLVQSVVNAHVSEALNTSLLERRNVNIELPEEIAAAYRTCLPERGTDS